MTWATSPAAKPALETDGCVLIAVFVLGLVQKLRPLGFEIRISDRPATVAEFCSGKFSLEFDIRPVQGRV